jgi:hypothetical protein
MYNDLIIIQKEMGDVNSYFMGPLRGPGSKGSEGSARLQRAGSKGCGIALSGDEYIISLREMKTIQPP